ncbi:MAG: hypothetical protein RLZZ529_1674 [Bacteroidota bacterium]|jgi:hypothetical protein
MHHKTQTTLESAVERQIVEEGVTRAKRTGEANEKLFERSRNRRFVNSYKKQSA